MNKPQYQLVIVGGGPAGLTAGLYAARGRIKALLIEKGATGGQVLITDWVDNYPGFVDGVSGFDLMDKMTAHVDRFGLEKKFAAITSLDLQGEVRLSFDLTLVQYQARDIYARVVTLKSDAPHPLAGVEFTSTSAEFDARTQMFVQMMVAAG